MRAPFIVSIFSFGLLVTFSGVAGADNTSICVEVIEREDWKTPAKKEEDKQVEVKKKAPPTETNEKAKKNPYADTEGDGNDSGTPAVDPEAFDGPKVKSIFEDTPIKPQPKEPKQPEKRAESQVSQVPTSFVPTMIPVNLGSNLPIGQTSVVYLKRLIEHFVTHEEGFVAATEGQKCSETITVELYPLKRGWTAFARYSGTSREERVDQLFPNELSQFAERSVLALLHDVPLSATINRENVLKSDSKKSVQRVKGSNHFVLSLGTQLRGGYVDSVIEEGENAGGTERKIRLFSPLKAALGYRGRFESWGLETMVHVGIGTGKTALKKNPEGGHVDLGGDTGVGIHFLRYMDPRGLTSFYLGAGGTFELQWFQAIKPEQNRGDDPRSTLFSGGIDVDLIFGWEFMRAAAVQFYLQGELNLPAYVVRSEDTYGSVDTWLPGISLKLGVVF